MPRDLISPKTRLELRECFVGTTLAYIDDAFALADVRCDYDYEPQLSGARRSHVERYYRTLNFRTWEDVRKFLTVCEHVLDQLEESKRHGATYEANQADRSLDTLLRCLRRDGFILSDGRLVPSTEHSSVQSLHDAVSSLDAPEFARQLDRLRVSVNQDPALAIGTAKEMLETTCKTILEDLSAPIDTNWDVPTLLKETRKHLKLLPDDIPSAAKGADTIRRLLSNLGQIGHGLSELRNFYGSGHGRNAQSRGLSPRHARLAVGAVATLVQFLFETHRDRKSK